MHRRSPGAVGPGDRRAAGGRRPAPERIGPGRARHRGQGPHGPRPGWRAPARPSSFPTVAGAPAISWCGCTPPAGAGGVGRSSRSASRDFVRFLACWQHVAAGTQAEGRAGLLAVIEQLQGLEVAAGEWERQVLPARVAGYDPRWLDELCLAGEVAWARLTPRPEREPSPAPVDGAATPATAPRLVDAFTGHAPGPRGPPGPGLDAGRRAGRQGPDRADGRGFGRRPGRAPPAGAPASGRSWRRHRGA